jgi:hypothetical protein
MSKAERTPRAARSLLMLVQALEGTSLIVELSNDTVVRGRVESVDDAMKCVAACRSHAVYGSPPVAALAAHHVRLHL